MSKWGKPLKEPLKEKKDEKPKPPDATPPSTPLVSDDYGRTGEYRLPTEDDKTVVAKLDAQLADELEKRDERQVELQELIRREKANAATTAELAAKLPKRVAAPAPVKGARVCKSCGNLIPDGARVCTVDGTEQL